MAKTTKMTKSARNEVIKLRATFLNNVAVGLAVGGALVPYFALMPRVMSVGFWFSDYARGAEPRIAIHVTDWIAIAISFMTILAAAYFTLLLRRMADRLIRTIR